MTWPKAVDAGGWMRQTERRIRLLERRTDGGGGSTGGGTTLTVQDTATLDLTLSGSPGVGYVLSGDVLVTPGEEFDGDFTPFPSPSLTDLNGDDVNNWSTTWQAKRWDYRRGSTTSPTQGGGPGIKISQTENITDLATQMGGSQGQNQANAALHVAATSLPGSLGQTNAILGTVSATPGPGADVCAIAGWARNKGTRGTAFGGYFEGRRDLAGAHAIGAEIGIRDNSSTDGVVDVSGFSDTMGAWISYVGNLAGMKAAAGVVLGTGNSCTWKVGYTVAANSVFNHTFRDESGSQVSFLSRGSHETGMDLASGTYTNTAISLPSGTTIAHGIKFGSDAGLFRSGPATLRSATKIESYAPAWQTPALAQGWVALDVPRTPMFRLMVDGTVMFRGMMKSGTFSTTGAVFTLPVGHRPAADESFLVVSDTGGARIVVKTTGDVLVWSYTTGGTNAFVSLSGIRFCID